MSKLTPFGVAIRKLRLDKGLRLMDLAAKLKMSSAFLSAIETGRKQIPDGFVVLIARTLNLSLEEMKFLRKGAERTRSTIKIEKLPEEQRELVAAFARRLDKVPADVMAQIKKHVLKSSEGEIPFQRSRRGIVVPPLSTDAIRMFSEKVRTAFVDDNQIEFPIMDVIEFRMDRVFDGFFIDVRDKASMGEDEGRVVGGTKCLALREDVYESAWNGDGRARFTACHELGHFLMHRTITMARTREDSDKIFCDAEWQADTFAGTLLMSPRHLGTFTDTDHAASLCKMTSAAAHVMWAKYIQEKRFPSAAEMPRFL